MLAGLVCLGLTACGEAPPSTDASGLASTTRSQTLAPPTLAPLPALSPTLNPVAAGTHRIEPGQAQPIRIEPVGQTGLPQRLVDDPDRVARPIDAASLSPSPQVQPPRPTIIVMPGAPGHTAAALPRPR